MKKQSNKQNRKQLPSPVFPDSRIYRTTCPKCGADVFHTPEMQHEKKLFCLSCGEMLPNPLYDPSDPYNVRRKLRRNFTTFLIGMAFMVLLWLGFRYISRENPPRTARPAVRNKAESSDRLPDYDSDMDSILWHTR
ncbi:MAG TPA: hypothetical protein DDZ96_08740 [Porphyromonadaceae bacterium]|jgi:rRNA maturation protein Nop10|nr:hypothetical protein [Porphyromonadaceae bacterium]HBK31492.1 hypothetical protein [Porphyromonadaceae bacterium]HBL33891.1 hypothetical protein [Porphyromonadaceae bacterium]HBX47265.1 hypothetical protein [Porphyromonadaceae bacterium]